MQPSADSEPRLPPGWNEMLTRVEQALAIAEAAASQREQALQAHGSQAVGLAGAGVLQGLERFRERIRGLAECPSRADALVAEADTALGDAEHALQGWFQSVEATRRTLPSWASKA